MDRREFLLSGAALPVLKNSLSPLELLKSAEKPFKPTSIKQIDLDHANLQNLLWDKIDLSSSLNKSEDRAELAKNITERLRFAWGLFFGRRSTFYLDRIPLERDESFKNRIPLKHGKYLIATRQHAAMDLYSFSYRKAIEDLECGLFFLADYLDIRLLDIRNQDFDSIKNSFNQKIINLFTQEREVWDNLFNFISHIEKSVTRLTFYESNPFTCVTSNNPVMRTMGFSFFHRFGILVECEDWSI